MIPLVQLALLYMGVEIVAALSLAGRFISGPGNLYLSCRYWGLCRYHAIRRAINLGYTIIIHACSSPAAGYFLLACTQIKEPEKSKFN
jgi:hypothetical protein